MTAAGARVGRFGRVQVEMLECVFQHRLLSTAQLHALYRDGCSLRRMQRALAAMERVGWLASVRAPGGMKLWFVTDAGADAVETIGNRAETRRKVISPELAAGPLQEHTLAVNEVGVAFARAARERGPDEFGPLGWRNEIAHPIGARRSQVVIADAELRYLQVQEDRSVLMHAAFLELDRATMALEALVAKLGRYVRLHAYAGSGRAGAGSRPLWRTHYPRFPVVLVVLANASHRRLRNRRWLVQSVWKREYADRARSIRLRVCLFEDLIEQGPFAPIFKCSRAEGLDWLGNPPAEFDTPAEEADQVEPAAGAEAQRAEEPAPEPPAGPEPDAPAPEPSWPAHGDAAGPCASGGDVESPLAASLRVDEERLRELRRRR